MASVERILIVGGGIAGLTLASALHQQGFRPELVERSPEWPAVGAGIALQANGLRALRPLGLDIAVQRAGAVMQHWAWCDQQGDVLCDTDLVDLWGAVAPCVGIARPALQQVLLEEAAAIPCRLGTAVTEVSQEYQEQRVRVRFSDGSWSEYDLVVGADGIASTVRELALGKASIGYTGVMMWRSIVPTRTPGVTDTLTILLGKGCLFGQVPMGAGCTYGFGYVNEPRIHDPLEGRRDRLCQRFAAASYSSVTPPMPAHRRWASLVAWQWKTPACWPRSYERQKLWSAPWIRTSAVVGRVTSGSCSKVAQSSSALTVRLPFATLKCVSGAIRRCTTASGPSSQPRSRRWR